MNNFRSCSKMKFVLLQPIFFLTNFIIYCIITLSYICKTVGTLLMRMEKKGAVSSKKINRVNFYAPLIDKDNYTAEQTKNLISRLYNGSVKDLAVSLFKSKSLTKDDINELKEMFDL